MDNAVVVGVGNIYANETLFLCGLHPMKLAENLTRNQCALLVETIKNVLAKAITQGGTTLKDFLQPDGRPGYFAQELLVYGNKDKPCPKCGTKIESMIIGQRNSFLLPSLSEKEIGVITRLFFRKRHSRNEKLAWRGKEPAAYSPHGTFGYYKCESPQLSLAYRLPQQNHLAFQVSRKE